MSHQVVVVNEVDTLDEGNEEYSEQRLKLKLSQQELEEELEEAMQHSRLMWARAKGSEDVYELMHWVEKLVKMCKSQQQKQPILLNNIIQLVHFSHFLSVDNMILVSRQTFTMTA